MKSTIHTSALEIINNFRYLQSMKCNTYKASMPYLIDFTRQMFPEYRDLSDEHIELSIVSYIYRDVM
jgi:hypothetical protein